jgi:hypothetical protein
MKCEVPLRKISASQHILQLFLTTFYDFLTPQAILDGNTKGGQYPQAKGEMATTLTEHETLILSIAAKNGVFTDDMVERAKHDALFGALLDCAQNLKTIANSATFK